MKRLSFTYTTTIEFSSPVADHSFVLRCLPSSGNGQKVLAELTLDPQASFAEQRDSFGNRLAIGQIEQEHTSFTYRVDGSADVDLASRRPCEAHPLFRYESPLAKMSDDLRGLLADAAGVSNASSASMGLFGGDEPTIEGCERLSAAVHEALRYEPGSTTVHTTAAEAASQGAGVCQDFAHVLIALLRAAGVPARYVSGLTLGEGATHAWVQAHVGGRWVGFDPTRGVGEDERYVAIAYGRDWSDCPVERGTFIGFADQTQTVFMRVEQR